MKNTLEEINSRLNDTDEWIREMEDRVDEITDAKQKKKIEFKRSLVQHQGHEYSHYMVPEEERNRQRTYLKTQ